MRKLAFKNIITYLKTFIILALLSATLLHCVDDDPPLTEIEKLPPKTQSGKGTFGCLVNGKAWVVKNSYHTVAVYQKDIFYVGGDIDEANRDQNMSVVIESSIIEEKKYSLTDFPDSYCRFIYSSPINCWYDPEHALNGQLILTKVDINNRIISGEFEFTMVKDECDTIEVTDGRFDLRLSL